MSDGCIKLLDRGLTFVPTVSSFDEKEIIEATAYIERSLLLKDFFHDRPSDQDTSSFDKKFINRSTWMPPTRAISTATLGTIKNMRLKTEQKIASIRYNACSGTRIRHPKIKDNLTVTERQALNELRKNNDIIIKPADKGGAVIIMDRENYITEGMRQLSDPTYYKQLETAIFPESVGLINGVIQKLLDNKYISPKQYEFLSAKPTAKQRQFYLLPKIHKNKEDWPTGHCPPGRPIVADCDSESYNISSYIDYWLQPIATSHESYIKDTYDFIEKIRGVEVDENDLLVTGDVSSLYTNMKIELILLSVQEAFNEAPATGRPDKEILELLKLTLERNDFAFNDQIFLQICGTAMGKKYAPSLANIYLKRFDKAAQTGFRIKPKLYWRYLDDIILIFPGTRHELQEYQAFLNSIIEGIKVELKARDRIIEFLDTYVYKTQENEQKWILKTKPYFKPTDTHQLLHAASFHPRHTTRGILKSQFIRFKRIASSYEDYNEAAKILGAVLTKRGYSSRLFRRLKLNIWHKFDVKRKKLVAKTEAEILPIINHYDGIQSSLNREWRTLINNNAVFAKFRKISAYKNHINLRQLLVRSHLQSKNTPSTVIPKTATCTQNPAVLDCNNFKINKCGHPLCKCCNHINPTNAIYVPHVRHTVHIDENMNCSNSNIIYIIICKKCKKSYIGETKNKLKERLNKHRSDIKKRVDTAISIHYNSAGHNITHLRVFPLEQLQMDDDKFRKKRESMWIKKLNTKYPNGLNVYPL